MRQGVEQGLLLKISMEPFCIGIPEDVVPTDTGLVGRRSDNVGLELGSKNTDDRGRLALL